MPFLVRCVGLAAIEVIFVCGVDDGRNPRFFLGKGAKLRHGCNCVIIVLGRNHRFRTMHGCVDPLLSAAIALCRVRPWSKRGSTSKAWSANWRALAKWTYPVVWPVSACL